jgi:hypothetical protein
VVVRLEYELDIGGDGGDEKRNGRKTGGILVLHQSEYL